MHLHILPFLPLLLAASITTAIPVTPLIEELYTSGALSLANILNTHPTLSATLTALSGPITVFVPTELAFQTTAPPGLVAGTIGSARIASFLEYHIVNGTSWSAGGSERVFLKTMRKNDANWGEGTDLRIDSNDRVFFGLKSAKILKSTNLPSIKATLVYIDTFLTPPVDLLNTASANPSTSAYNFFVEGSNSREINKLQGTTVLVPTNDAFQAAEMVLGSVTQAQLKSLLVSHLIPGVFYTTNFPSFASGIQSYLRTPSSSSHLSVIKNATGSFISTPTNDKTGAAGMIVDSDVLIETGVMHSIDCVLIPEEVVLGNGWAGGNVTQLPRVTETVLGGPGGAKATSTATGIPTSGARGRVVGSGWEKWSGLVVALMTALVLL
ncbi:hypothetical protein HDV05_007455 [Chytridiales sp. JEL 0842]|nr:hypothetical protein HDV05_007455 [Chytridiales sp. JEL 0842]